MNYPFVIISRGISSVKTTAVITLLMHFFQIVIYWLKLIRVSIQSFAWSAECLVPWGF